MKKGLARRNTGEPPKVASHRVAPAPGGTRSRRRESHETLIAEGATCLGPGRRKPLLPLRSVIACSVRTVVSMSSRSNWPRSRAVGPAMYSRRLRCRASPSAVRSSFASPRISPSASSRASSSRVESGSRVREPSRSRAQRLAGEPRPARGDQLQGVPGLGRGMALGEVPAQGGRQRPLGEGEGLSELAVGGGWCGHVGPRFTRIDRCLTTLTSRQAPVYPMEPNFPARPLIGLLLRLLYQHYAQDIDAALREAGFGDIRPPHANVFPFVPPEGITVSELAELARVRKQTMAAGGRSTRAHGLRRAPPEPARPPLAAGLPHRARRSGPAGHARDRRARRGALGRADEPRRSSRRSAPRCAC